jgi:hypothetical protein
MASYRLARPVRRLAGQTNAQAPVTSLLGERNEGAVSTSNLILGMNLIVLTRPSSYVAALELRVEKLDKQIKYAKERRASMANHEGEKMTMDDRRDSLAAIRVAVQRKEEFKQERADIDSLVSDFGLV